MKILEKYKNLKQEYLKYVILFKSGIFYITYNDDAYIMNYLFNYEIKDNKIGFPIKSIDKVLEKLTHENINVLIYDENNELNFENNNYDNILYMAQKKHFNILNKKVLLEEISFLLNTKPEYITKIKEFIDEL